MKQKKTFVKKTCEIFPFFSFCLGIVFGLSSESTRSSSLQLHIIVFSIRFFFRCLIHFQHSFVFSFDCSFHVQENNHSLTLFLVRLNATCIYPNLLVVSLMCNAFMEGSKHETDTFFNIRFLD